jgi:hypothetical protein
MTYEELDFEPVSTWDGDDKTCHYCGESIEVGDRVRYRGGGPYDRGLRHASCARDEKSEED